MTRSELIERLSRRFTNLSVPMIKVLIKEMFETMSLSLTRGDRIEIRGFGSFGVRFRRSRLARNPRTGEQLLTQGKQAPFFKAGKLLKERVDNTDATLSGNPGGTQRYSSLPGNIAQGPGVGLPHNVHYDEDNAK